MMTSSSGTYRHVASVAVVMKKNHVEQKFNELENTCQTSLQTYLYIQLALLLPILAFCMILTDKITKSIILPIDRLAKILKKMKDGDLAIDILATYEPSPLEIHTLYEVFDKLRVVLRFNSITAENITEAFFVYSQALHLFIQFGNERGMEFCYRELGCICYKQRQWEEAAELLNNSLKLVLKFGGYELSEVAKRKTETAKAFFKARTDKNYAMNLFAEALETFSKSNNSTQIVFCLIEVAETLLETQDLSITLLDFIEKNLDNCETYERSIVSQRFLFIKASYLRTQKRYREACYLLSNIIEMHCDFIPEIWINSVNLLILICKDCSVDSTSLIPLQSQRQFIRKDIVLVLSESLIGGPISWILPGFLKSILDPNDRLSFLQFGSQLKVNFNLTRFPMNIFSLESEDSDGSGQKVLYDCVIEGFRQLRVNSVILKDYRQCKECMIIVTDCVDHGSESKFMDFVNLIESSEIEVIVVNCFLEERIFDALLLATEKCSVFHIKYKEQAKLVFRQLEAFLCPYKEVYLG